MMKKREFILFSIEKGLICYHCNDDIFDMDSDPQRSIDLLSKEGVHRDLCVPCKRDEALNSLLNKKSIKTIIEDLSISRHYKIIYFFLLIGSVVLNILNVFTKIPILGVVASLFLFSGQYFFYIRTKKATRIKKTQSRL
jgi:hypothetical protein